MKPSHLAAALSLAFLAGPGPAAAGPVDAAIRAQTIEALASQLNEHYVFPKAAKYLISALRAKQQQGEYDHIGDADAFAKTLTEDMREAGGDKLLLVRAAAPAAAEKSPEAGRQGVVKAELMAGNVGYLQLDHFKLVSEGGPGIMGAMTTLADSAALIVDVRDNTGGDSYTAAFLSAYLFDKRTHLNDVYWREGDTLQQFFTVKNILGKPYALKKPVYVLIGPATSSTAEGFSYSLQQLKRATLVGALTAGTASFGRLRPLNRHFNATIPVGRTLNPITKTNWETSGVSPDIAVPADQALATAHAMALKSIAAMR